jgi:hypothetical protein
MNCDCVVSFDNYGKLPELFVKKEIKARKEHICIECKRIIKPSEIYEKNVGKWDGEISIYKVCRDCISIRKMFFKDGFYFGEIYQDLITFLREIDGEVSSDCIKKLTPNARAKVCDMLEEIWKDNNEKG